MKKRVAYQGTKVNIGRSIEGIRKLLKDNGVQSLSFGEDNGGGFSIDFTFKNLPVCLRFHADGYFQAYKSTHPKSRKPDSEIREEAGKIMYRHAYNYLKITMESIEFGLIKFESAFMAHFVDNRGMTLGESLIPRLADISSGKFLLEAPK